jgi:hypothetical protein
VGLCGKAGGGVTQPVTDEQQERQAARQEPRESAHEERFRRIFSWVVLIATTVWGTFAAVHIGYYSLQPDSLYLRMLEQHFAALVGVPMAALIAMCVVILLRFSGGPMRFKALGVEFQGATGQVVFWIFCFLAIITALKLLW